jgi:hypothetical protein
MDPLPYMSGEARLTYYLVNDTWYQALLVSNSTSPASTSIDPLPCVSDEARLTYC